MRRYWEGPYRWINTILLVIVGFIGFDLVFRLLEARETNAVVSLVRTVANGFLAPFSGMFPEQDFLLTAIIAMLGYSLLAGIAAAIVRSIQSSRPPVVRRERVVEPEARREHVRETVRRERVVEPEAGGERVVEPEARREHVVRETERPIGP